MELTSYWTLHRIPVLTTRGIWAVPVRGHLKPAGRHIAISCVHKFNIQFWHNVAIANSTRDGVKQGVNAHFSYSNTTYPRLRWQWHSRTASNYGA